MTGAGDTPNVDFGRTADDYARFRAGFPDSLFERLAGEGLAVAGQSALDLGTGTGTMARGLARLGLAVTGIDLAPGMLAQARAIAAGEGLDVDFIEGRAEATGCPNAGLDLVVAGQCWHWFDRPAAACEALRVLKPGGRLLIAHFDWLPIGDNIVAQTEQLILRHNPDWGGAGGRGIYPWWYSDLRTAGFGAVSGFSYDESVRYSHEAWRGRIRASAGVAASLPPDAVAVFDAEHAAMLAERFPEEPLAVPHCVSVVTGVKSAV
jgi:SAM-dependent methyltransferase